MAYRDFTNKRLIEELGISFSDEDIFLNKKVTLVQPSAFLQENMKRAELSMLTTEKAICEHYISPILSEIMFNNLQRITLFSGEQLNVDKKKGLNGEIDFLFTLKTSLKEIQKPVFSITEAKIGKLTKSLPQATAQLYAAQKFNELENKPLIVVYGAVTDGKTWQFMKIQKQLVVYDIKTYYIDNLPLLLGTLQYLVDSICEI
jgi:hypothetical protein